MAVVQRTKERESVFMKALLLTSDVEELEHLAEARERALVEDERAARRRTELRNRIIFFLTEYGNLDKTTLSNLNNMSDRELVTTFHKTLDAIRPVLLEVPEVPSPEQSYETQEFTHAESDYSAVETKSQPADQMYRETTTELSKGYDVYNTVINGVTTKELVMKKLNMIDSSLILSERYEKALHNLGLSDEDIKDLRNRYLFKEHFDEKGVIVLPVIRVRKAGDGVLIDAVPFLVRVTTEEEGITVRVADPYTGERVKRVVDKSAKIRGREVFPKTLEQYTFSQDVSDNTIYSAVYDLLKEGKLPRGFYALPNGIHLEKEGELWMDDLLAGGAIVVGAGLMLTGVGGPVGAILIYSGNAYFAAESAAELVHQGKMGVFDLSSAETQVALGSFLLSASFAGRAGATGFKLLSKSGTLAGKVALGTKFIGGATSIAGMGSVYIGGTEMNARMYGELSAQDQSVFLPVLFQGLLIASTTAGVYGEGKMMYRTYSQIRETNIEYMASSGKVRWYKDNNKLNEDVVKAFENKGFDRNTKVTCVQFDKRRLSMINNTFDEKVGDAALTQEKKMVNYVAAQLKKAGYVVSVGGKGGDEIYLVTNAPKTEVEKVINEANSLMKRAERTLYEPAINKGCMTESTVDKITGADYTITVSNVGELESKGVVGVLAEAESPNYETFKPKLFNVEPLEELKNMEVDMTGKKSGNVRRFIMKEVKAGKKVYHIEIRYRVARISEGKVVKSVLMEAAGHHSGKASAPLEKDVVKFTAYNNVGHDIGDDVIEVNRKTLALSLPKGSSFYVKGTSEVIVALPEDADVNQFLNRWSENIGKVVKGVEFNPKIVQIASPEALESQVSNKEIGFYRSVVWRDIQSPEINAVRSEIRRMGFDLDNIPENLRMSEMQYITNPEGMSLLEAMDRIDPELLEKISVPGRSWPEILSAYGLPNDMYVTPLGVVSGEVIYHSTKMKR